MFGIGTVSQTAINPNYVFTVDTSNTSSADPSLTSYKFHTNGTSGTATGSILWEEVGNPSNSGVYTWVSNNSPTITFPSEGVYRISIPNSQSWGRPHNIANAAYASSKKITEINNWGNHRFTTGLPNSSSLVNSLSTSMFPLHSSSKH